MMHYKASEESSSNLGNEGFLLVDSGGQYFEGTTDTTRTIALGKLTDEEKQEVLKSVTPFDYNNWIKIVINNQNQDEDEE